MRPTVLLLSTYPFIEPRHGGQVRLANIAKEYSDAGWKVASIAVYEPELSTGAVVGELDVSFPVTRPYRFFQERFVPLVNDLLAGIYAAKDDGGFPKILRRLPARTEAIHIEQPWLWPLAKKLAARQPSGRPVLILGSQNIEAPLKRELLASLDISSIDEVINAIAGLEREAATEADLTLAVTEADLEILQKFGARNTLLAPNGIAPWSASEDALVQWKEKLPCAPWILYVASAHPPNFTHFAEVLGGSLACIPPDSRLVVAGSVTEHIYGALAKSSWSGVNLSRLQLLYSLPDEDLSAVKTLAHAFLLPIPHGGGSNIKTAEAIYSGAYVVGTQEAFRGFERFLSLPEVSIAKTPRDMQNAIRRILQSPRAPAGERKAMAMRAELRWDRCLAALPKAVSKLLIARQST